MKPDMQVVTGIQGRGLRLRRSPLFGRTSGYMDTRELAFAKSETYHGPFGMDIMLRDEFCG